MVSLICRHLACSSMLLYVNTAAAPSITTKNAELTDIINEELEAIYTGQKTVEEGLESAKTRGDAALAG